MNATDGYSSISALISNRRVGDKSSKQSNENQLQTKNSAAEKSFLTAEKDVFKAKTTESNDSVLESYAQLDYDNANGEYLTNLSFYENSLLGSINARQVSDSLVSQEASLLTQLNISDSVIANLSAQKLSSETRIQNITSNLSSVMSEKNNYLSRMNSSMSFIRHNIHSFSSSISSLRSRKNNYNSMESSPTSSSITANERTLKDLEDSYDPNAIDASSTKRRIAELKSSIAEEKKCMRNQYSSIISTIADQINSMEQELSSEESTLNELETERSQQETAYDEKISLLQKELETANNELANITTLLEAETTNNYNISLEQAQVGKMVKEAKELEINAQNRETLAAKNLEKADKKLTDTTTKLDEKKDISNKSVEERKDKEEKLATEEKNRKKYKEEETREDGSFLNLAA